MTSCIPDFMTLIPCICEWAHLYIPIAPKKSFPRKGKPGLLASTIILKSGCKSMVLVLPSASLGSLKKEQC